MPARNHHDGYEGHDSESDTVEPERSLTTEQANADAMVRGFTGAAQTCSVPTI